jgi:hypothetical protein
VITIHAPRLTDTEKGRCQLSAQISMRIPNRSVPGELWFRVDARWKAYLLPRADAFLAAMVPLAAALGEDIEVEGPVSPKLLHGAREYLRVIHARSPSRNHLVQIRAHDVCAAPRMPLPEGGPADGASCAFSGGIDAFHTLWTHLPANEPIEDYRIRSVLMVNGFDLDVDLEERDLFPALRAIYKPMFDELGIDFIVVGTNLREFRQPILRSLLPSYASAITACALAMGSLFRRFYISSSYRYDAQGTVDDLRPIVDPLLGTEATDILYGSAEATRFQRLQTISQWPATWSRLRVCTNPDWRNVDTATGQVVNCCQCGKCQLAQIALQLTGTADRFTTFPQPLTRQTLRQMRVVAPSLPRFREYIEQARATGRHEFAGDLRHAYSRSRWKLVLDSLRWKRLQRRVQRCLHPGGKGRSR